VAEAVGDGSREVASQTEQQLRGSTGRSRIGIISAMRGGEVVEKDDQNPQRCCNTLSVTIAATIHLHYLYSVCYSKT
jgi:hypothetical protein